MVCEEKDGSSDSVPPLRRGSYLSSRIIHNIETRLNRFFGRTASGGRARLRKTASLREVPA